MISIASVLPSLLAAVVGGLIAVGAQYLIVYDKIEKPKLEVESKKIDLEIRKAAIEAHKQALLLSPHIAVACNASFINKWTWKVICNTQNKGDYPTGIAIKSVNLRLSTDTSERPYGQASGFAIDYLGRQEYRASPSSSGDMWFYLKFDPKVYKDGVNRSDVVVRIEHEFKTAPLAKKIVADQFPDLLSFIESVSTSGAAVQIELPLPAN